MFYSRQWSENVQNGPQRADAFMHNFEWIYLSHGYTNITFSLLPVDSMHFSVHYGIKTAHDRCVAYLSPPAHGSHRKDIWVL